MREAIIQIFIKCSKYSCEQGAFWSFAWIQCDDGENGLKVVT
jgi:hypothetical protein